MQTVEEVIRSGSVSIIVVDSVAALLPASEIAREAGDPQIGAQAKLMSNHLKRIAASAAKYNVAVLFINQLRMKIGVMFGNPEVCGRTPTGPSGPRSLSVCTLCLCFACHLSTSCALPAECRSILWTANGGGLRTHARWWPSQHVRQPRGCAVTPSPAAAHAHACR